MITLPKDWVPREHQIPLWQYLMGGGQRASICWQRRYGKDETCLMATSVLAHQRVGSYWHMLPEKEQARKALWTMINPHTGKKRIDEAFPPEIRARTNDQEMFIELLNGSTWQLAGSDNYNSLVGSSPCGIVFSEYALANPQAWAYLRPIIRENQGWVIFVSTPRGKNHFYRLHTHAFTEPGWFAQTLSQEDTHLLSEEALAAELRELQAEHGDTYGKNIWLQENFCSFDAAIPGAIWADALDRVQKDGRIVDFSIDPSVPVYTAWDLGRTDDTSIWWYQQRGEQLDVFDFFSSSGMDIEVADDPEHSLTHVLLDRAERWGFRYATNWVPHDARPRRQGMGGKSILQQFQDAASRHPVLGRFAIVPHLDKQEGIQAARKTFQSVRFHQTRCAEGLEALRHYHRKWDPELKVYMTEPVHDWSSHPADAWRYLSLSWRLATPQKRIMTKAEEIQEMIRQPQTFGDVKRQHLRRKARERSLSWSQFT